jgi:uncharacterized membrane protein
MVPLTNQPIQISMSTNVLLVGESWVSTSTHIKGFDFFSSSLYAIGGDFLISALQKQGIQMKHLPGHEAAKDFPFKLEDLQRFDVVILSDVGANTLLLPPETFLEGKRVPNRLELIKEYVLRGGGLVMAGGYLSFQGIYGAARYSKSPIEDVLPVALLPVDDRVEKPEGVNPRVIDNTHFITERIQAEWPYLLGFNEVSVKKGADLLVKVQDHPLLVVGSFGKGRSVAWTSDIGPHWCPKEFVEWPGYGEVWVRIVQWAAQGRGEG